MILTEINKVALQCKTNSHFLLEAVQILVSHLKSAITMQCGFHNLIAQQFSTIFSAGCYF